MHSTRLALARSDARSIIVVAVDVNRKVKEEMAKVEITNYPAYEQSKEDIWQRF